jgi:hypothetical protein
MRDAKVGAVWAAQPYTIDNKVIIINRTVKAPPAVPPRHKKKLHQVPSNPTAGKSKALPTKQQLKSQTVGHRPESKDKAGPSSAPPRHEAPKSAPSAAHSKGKGKQPAHPGNAASSSAAQQSVASTERAEKRPPAAGKQHVRQAIANFWNDRAEKMKNKVDALRKRLEAGSKIEVPSGSIPTVCDVPQPKKKEDKKREKDKESRPGPSIDQRDVSKETQRSTEVTAPITMRSIMRKIHKRRHHKFKARAIARRRHKKKHVAVENQGRPMKKSTRKQKDKAERKLLAKERKAARDRRRQLLEAENNAHRQKRAEGGFKSMFPVLARLKQFSDWNSLRTARLKRLFHTCQMLAKCAERANMTPYVAYIDEVLGGLRAILEFRKVLRIPWAHKVSATWD